MKGLLIKIEGLEWQSIRTCREIVVTKPTVINMTLTLELAFLRYPLKWLLFQDEWCYCIPLRVGPARSSFDLARYINLKHLSSHQDTSSN